VTAVLVTSLAVGPALGLIVLSVGEVQQGVKVTVSFKDDVAAFTTVAAVWASQRDEFLSPEADAAPTAIAAFDVDFGLINEHWLRRAFRADAF
jgi:hypothetical protein